MRAIRFSVAAMLFVLGTSAAHAMGVTWTFQNAFFDDGTALTGSFVYNSDSFGSSGYSNVNVMTQAGSALSGVTYNDVTLFSGGLGFTSISGDQVLGILLDDWIGYGGTHSGPVGAEGTETLWGTGTTTATIGSWQFEVDVPIILADRHLVSGHLVSGALATATEALPEPATLVMFLLGVTMVLVTVRRKALI